MTCTVLFGVGMFEGLLAGQSKSRSGMEFLVIALIATGIGYAVGFAIEALSGVSLPKV